MKAVVTCPSFVFVKLRERCDLRPSRDRSAQSPAFTHLLTRLSKINALFVRLRCLGAPGIGGRFRVQAFTPKVGGRAHLSLNKVEYRFKNRPILAPPLNQPPPPYFSLGSWSLTLLFSLDKHSGE